MQIPARTVIATRASALALWQAHHVRSGLLELHPDMSVEVLGLTTKGDRMLATSLAKIGGKGLFVKELETAVEEGRADFAVHSMKDVPVNLPPGFTLAAILPREDARDAFVSNRYRALADLPPGSIVGTSSLRRESQLRARFPALSVEPLRGNVNTRLRKLDEDRYAAIILAAAGLRRLGLAGRIRALLEPQDSIPAVGQGALGLECRAEHASLIELLRALEDPVTAWCVRAERAVSRALGGSCVVPLGAYAWLDHSHVRIRGCVARPDGTQLVSAALEDGDLAQNPEAFGERLADQLTARGAREILDALEHG